MREPQKRCKHNAGWWKPSVSVCIKPGDYVFIGMSGFGRKERAGKIRMECNCGCGAWRNVYFDTGNGRLTTLGRIHRGVPHA